MARRADPRRLSETVGIRCLLMSMAAIVTWLPQKPANADQLLDLARKAGIRVLADGESSSDSQRQAMAAIPLRAMTPTNRQRTLKVIESCSQYRRLPGLQYTVDEPIYRYLLSHPDVAVSTWRVMGISRFEMWQTGPVEFEAKAVDGSEGVADILYQDDTQMVFVCEGTYHNPLLLKPLAASAIVWFRYSTTPHIDGTAVVTQKADVWVKFPSVTYAAVAKVLTPVTNSMMDRNLLEVSLYGCMMSRAVRDEPEWIINVAEQLDGVLPQRRKELADVARLPRRGIPSPAVSSATDREIIMSPELLFFDPPKSTTPAAPATTSQSIPVKTVSSPGGSSQQAAELRTNSAQTGQSHNNDVRRR